VTTTTVKPIYYVRRLNAYVAELWRRRDFIWFMAKGNIKARNASTVLGLIWWVLNPLLLGLVYYAVFGFLIPGGRDIAYLLSGIFVFHFTSQALTGGANSILSNSRLLVNIRFPRLILPITYLLESAFGFVASLIVLYAIIGPFSGIWPGPRTMLLLLLVPLQFVFNLGLSSLSARLALPFRDINNLVPYLNRIWLYMSPIIWPLEQVDRLPDWVQGLVRLNPMFPIIAVYRTALLDYTFDLADLIASVAWAVAVGIIGIGTFIKYEGRMVRHL